eukprot:COSAG01_NODE_7872_length_3014_cov_4.542710_4_plen_92_part_00
MTERGDNIREYSLVAFLALPRACNRSGKRIRAAAAAAACCQSSGAARQCRGGAGEAAAFITHIPAPAQHPRPGLQLWRHDDMIDDLEIVRP